jgi:regulator of replication initiation timing
VDIFNLSFLDVVSCGFGAIILLLVIVKVSEPHVIEKLAVDLSGLVHRLQAELHEIRGETDRLHRELTDSEQQLSASSAELARLQGELSSLRGRYEAGRREADTQQRIERKLLRAQQSLDAELRRLLGEGFRRRDNIVGGVPVDSEYIVFIIDTSGSMQKGAWPLVLKKVTQVLDIYPHVKGIQVMNDMGDYMFSQYQGSWIPDTAARRKAIVERLAGWAPFSNSSPVEGIEAAIRRFYASDKRISLYVFGDDFSRGSIQQVVDTVAQLNRAGPNGRRRVRIHTIGFPVQFLLGGMPDSSVRFAALMRKLAEDNNGSFVGLNSTQ